ncbi:MAG TPA: site-specific DNA-methyltransferase [Methanoculleus sp.]|nr:site-specific DNA-methyltransferase [Methanoculleus sp.]
MKHEILVGDVLAGLRAMPDASVQCVVTSPPYWGLRDYGVEGQIGLEPTPEEYVEKMVEVFREVKRVLRDDGTLWLNYGDCYCGSWGNAGHRPEIDGTPSYQREKATEYFNRGGWDERRETPPNQKIPGLKPKDLVGMPWRIAFALQADGWYLRSDIIWSKPNPMPESVTDRPTKSHEYVFLLAKRERYFYDIDSIRDPPTGRTGPMRFWKKGMEGQAKGNRNDAERVVQKDGSIGRNRRTVWEIPTQPTPEAHFATFPEALVKPCIMAGTSERGACPSCGAPWRRVVEAHRLRRDELDPSDPRYRPHRYSGAYEKINGKGDAGYQSSTTLGWAPSCTCGTEETVPCVVLDPFGGSGTVAKVARDLGRSSVMIELNPAYVGIMKKRLRVGEQLDTGVCEYAVREVGV